MPLGEFMQTAHLLHELMPGAKMQMIGVCKHYARADLGQISRSHSFYGRLRADRHKAGRFDRAVRRVQSSSSRTCLSANLYKFVSYRLLIHITAFHIFANGIMFANSNKE
jgi:hypothetical protein